MQTLYFFQRGTESIQARGKPSGTLRDVCGYRGCLIADRDGISDPGSANGRLLLGLTGHLSELELHSIRARMPAGLLNMAQRGE